MFTSAKAGALSFPTLIDAGDGSVNLSPHDMTQILANIRELASRSKIAKCAVLVSNQSSLATVATITQLLATVSPIEGFLDRNDAERWLGWKI